MTRMMTVLTVCALFLAVPAAAQTPPPATQATPPAPQQPSPPLPAPVPFPADAKVGFISLQAVVAQSELGKAGSKQMQALTDAKNQQIGAKQKEITALDAKAKSQATIVSADALNNMTRELDRMNRELEFMKQQAQADVQLMNQDLLNTFEQKVLPIVEALRAERGMWVIFAVQGDETGGLAVAAAHPGLDLTVEVVKRLNAAAVK